jgi:hypothetical protein
MLKVLAREKTQSQHQARHDGDWEGGDETHVGIVLKLKADATLLITFPLSGLASLQRLSLGGCTGVSDLAPLNGLASLQLLDLAGRSAVSDLASLSGLAALRELLPLRRHRREPGGDRGIKRMVAEA